MEKPANLAREPMWGRLVVASSPKGAWVKLEVPQDFARGLFSMLNAPGAELSPGRAHITVMNREELEKIGGPDRLTERGKQFPFHTGTIRSVRPAGWAEMNRVWFVRCYSRNLEQLRASYGLPPRLNGHAFHITFAVRRNGVLSDNEQSKSAGLVKEAAGWETARNAAIGGAVGGTADWLRRRSPSEDEQRPSFLRRNAGLLTGALAGAAAGPLSRAVGKLREVENVPAPPPSSPLGIAPAEHAGTSRPAGGGPAPSVIENRNGVPKLRGRAWLPAEYEDALDQAIDSRPPPGGSNGFMVPSPVAPEGAASMPWWNIRYDPWNTYGPKLETGEYLRTAVPLEAGVMAALAGGTAGARGVMSRIPRFAERAAAMPGFAGSVRRFGPTMALNQAWDYGANRMFGVNNPSALPWNFALQDAAAYRGIPQLLGKTVKAPGVLGRAAPVAAAGYSVGKRLADRAALAHSGQDWRALEARQIADAADAPFLKRFGNYVLDPGLAAISLESIPRHMVEADRIRGEELLRGRALDTKLNTVMSDALSSGRMTPQQYDSKAAVNDAIIPRKFLKSLAGSPGGGPKGVLYAGSE